MGIGSFFSAIGDVIGDALGEVGRGLVNTKRAICRAVGTVIEHIGDITDNSDIYWAGVNLQYDNPYLEKSVDLEDSDTSVQDTINVHRICEELRQNTAVQAKMYEDELVIQIKKDINNYIDALSEIFPPNIMEQFDYGINDAFVDDIHNTVSDYVAQHISQDAEDFVAILKIQDDIVRKQKTEAYTSKIMQNSISLLEMKYRKKKIEICAKMSNDIRNYLENEKNVIEEYQKNIKEIQAHKDDAEYCGKQAVSIIKDLSYMECIRTLTYENS